ncbi:MAG: ParB/RepB/Spo0J family partition protein [Candidatus Margulisiibacteriota bacterium]|nr:ParB/RepB/Spo0J family partition protein [Candidatus Margulisiibacteriota bacterium]
MSTQQNRLGKGLDALIPNVIPKTQFAIEQIPIDLIKPNPFQPRQYFDESTLNELAQSIKNHGLNQPVLVRKINNYFELIVGERRLEACKINHFLTIPAIVKNISDKESCEIALVENIDRENLSVIEVAQSLKRLIDEFNYTQETLAKLFSRSRSSIANILRLLKLPSMVQDMVLNGSLSEGHARALIEFSSDEEKCIFIANEVIDKNLSVRQTERLAKSHKKQSEKPKQLHLFDNYIETLSEKLNTDVKIKHRKNELTISVSYDRFKDYISFLDQLCMIEMNSNES